jgi:hypothetical protein
MWLNDGLAISFLPERPVSGVTDHHTPGFGPFCFW